MSGEDVVDAKTAARLLGVTLRTIYRAAERAGAYGHRPLLVSLSEVGAVINPRAHTAVDEIDLATRLSPDARRAFATLNAATAAAAAAGRPPPCAADPDRWLGDDPAGRATAAAECAGCLAFAACGAYAEVAGEAWGTWAGVDRSARTAKKGAAA